MSLEIRPATPNDLAEIYDVMWSTAYIQTFYGGKPFEEIKPQLLAKLFASDVCAFVAIEEDRIVGYTIFAPYAEYYESKSLPSSIEFQGKQYDLRGYAYSLGTGVHEEYRGKNIGTQLRLYADEQARKAGFSGMVTDVDSSNIASLKAQLKAGFSKVAEIPDPKRTFGKNTLWIKSF